MRGCRKGLGMYIGSLDHGNPHIEVKQANTRLAKIFMQPSVALDPAVTCRLSDIELETVLNFMKNKNKLVEYKKEWNKVHKDNTSSQRAIIPEKK